MHLPPLDDRIERDADGVGDGLAVATDGVRVVVGPAAEVETRVRAPRRPAPPRGEQRPPARQRDPDVIADGLERGGQLHGADGSRVD